MKKSKLPRLLMGIIILFSIFLFQGADDLGGCSSCEGELGGTLTVINYIRSLIVVNVSPGGGSAEITLGNNHVFYLDEGLYQVVAIYGGITVVGVRMVEIKLGSDKTITFAEQ